MLLRIRHFTTYSICSQPVVMKVGQAEETSILLLGFLVARLENLHCRLEKLASTRCINIRALWVLGLSLTERDE